jgi:hypothetical protein
MSIFSKLFKSKNESKDPTIQFGRFSDAYKSEPNYEAWEKSVRLFENEKYLDSYKYFLDFLNDENTQNAHYRLLPGRIEFTIYQGSKIITGLADQFKLRAEAKIARVLKPELGWLRLLTEENYELKFCRYALDDENNITIVFDTYVEDGGPDKLYQALKELATTADKKDDILISEFGTLGQVNFYYTRHIPETEKEVKYRFFKHAVNNTIQIIETGRLNVAQVPGGMSYLLLALIYKLDYLVKPEGMLMECIENCHKIFFNENMLSVEQKNMHILRKIRETTDIHRDLFYKELYEVKSTFGITIPTGHERLSELIDAQINDVEWYYENGHLEYALSILDYIAGYALFSYALPAPTRALLYLYYRITENNYFRSLGYQQQFEQNGAPAKKAIVKVLKKLKQDCNVDFPQIKWNTDSLDFTDYPLFARSYILMIRDINLND